LKARERLIVALDVPAAEDARALLDRLAGKVGLFKIGSQLFTAAGPEFVRELVGRGEKVFLDLKFHDIPNTVAGAVSSAGQLGVSLVDVHALGEVGVAGALPESVERLARLAMDAGVDGVVASAHEVGLIRQACGQDFVIVTPGIRPAGAAAGDQARLATPAVALRAGADYLVIGRPITGAADPGAAADAIVAEMETA